MTALTVLLKREESNPLFYAIPRVLDDPSGRRIRLRELKVMIPDSDVIDHFNEHVRRQHLPDLVQNVKESLSQSRFDVVLIDFPASVSRHDMFSIAGLALCDHIIIPTEITEIALGALPITFKILEQSYTMAAHRGAIKPNLLGILPTKSNATHSQYKRHIQDLKKVAAANGTTVFKQHIPNSPSLANATDDTIKHEYLKERYGTAYDKVSVVAREIAKAAGVV